MKGKGWMIAVLAAGLVAVAAYAQERPSRLSDRVPVPEAEGAATRGMMGGAMGGGAMGGMMEGAQRGMMGAAMSDAAMMAERHEAMTGMHKGDAKLDQLVARMRSAKGSAKIEAMASVLSELVAQQEQMGHSMMSMEPEMMKHMMFHMKSGTMSGMEKSMASCPLVQEPAASAEGAQRSDHASHHPDSSK